ncbi:MAG: HAD hydrolase-like protein [Acidimicrobiia bacterium]|nr:HAD hydrolase-like protein [Acidimicrobiia bacterium]
MQSRKRCATFFDLDGVIIDSAPLITTLVRQVLSGHGIPVDDRLLDAFVGPPLEESFSVLLRDVGVPDIACDAVGLVAEFRDLYRARCVETEAHPGVASMLRSVARSVPCALATSKPREFALAILNHLELSDVFTVAAAPEPDWESDSKTAVLTAAFARMQVAFATSLEPADCLMVGDRRHDIEAAHTLGMLALGVTWGVGSREELIGASPDFLADDPVDVVRLVLELTGDDR